MKKLTSIKSIFLLTALIVTCLFACSCKKEPASSDSTPPPAPKPIKTQIIELLEYQDVQTIDIKGLSAYDLNDSIAEYDTDILEYAENEINYELLPMKYGKEYEVGATSIITFPEVAKGYYACIMYDGATKDKALYATYVDFYNSDDGFEWNTFNYKDDADKITLKGTGVASLITDIEVYYDNTLSESTTITAGVAPDGSEGDYYKITSETADYLGYAETTYSLLTPIHSASYYEKFSKYNYEITYNYMFRGQDAFLKDSGDNVEDADIWGMFGTIPYMDAEGNKYYKRRQIIPVNNDFAVRIPVNDYVVGNWSWNLVKEHQWFTVKKIWDETMSTAQAQNCYVGKTEIFINNITISGKYDSEIVDKGLIDLNEEESITFSAEEIPTTLDKKIYRIVGDNSELIENVDMSSGTIQFDALGNRTGVYEVRGIDRFGFVNNVIKFDLYDSNVKLEWAEFSDGASFDTVDKSGDFSYEIIDAENATGQDAEIFGDKTGEYMKFSRNTEQGFTYARFRLAPTHSMAYFDKMNADGVLKDYEIKFRVYIIAQSTEAPDNADGFIMVSNPANETSYKEDKQKFNHLQAWVNNNWNTYSLSMPTFYKAWQNGWLQYFFTAENFQIRYKDAEENTNWLTTNNYTYTVYVGGFELIYNGKDYLEAPENAEEMITTAIDFDKYILLNDANESYRVEKVNETITDGKGKSNTTAEMIKISSDDKVATTNACFSFLPQYKKENFENAEVAAILANYQIKYKVLVKVENDATLAYVRTARSGEENNNIRNYEQGITGKCFWQTAQNVGEWYEYSLDMADFMTFFEPIEECAQYECFFTILNTTNGTAASGLNQGRTNIEMFIADFEIVAIE